MPPLTQDYGRRSVSRKLLRISSWKWAGRASSCNTHKYIIWYVSILDVQFFLWVTRKGGPTPKAGPAPESRPNIIKSSLCSLTPRGLTLSFPVVSGWTECVQKARVAIFPFPKYSLNHGFEAYNWGQKLFKMSRSMLSEMGLEFKIYFISPKPPESQTE